MSIIFNTHVSYAYFETRAETAQNAKNKRFLKRTVESFSFMVAMLMDCQNFVEMLGCKFVGFYFAALQC